MPTRGENGRGWPALAAALLLVAPGASSAATLRAAAIEIAYASPLECQVTAVFSVQTAEAAVLEQRLHLLPGAAVSGLEVDGGLSVTGADAAKSPPHVLRLQADRAGDHRYRLRYTVTQTSRGEFRCPLWLPALAADARSQGLTLTISIPAGAAPGAGGLPALVWVGSQGTATLNHLPGFVRVPFRQAGEAAPLVDVSITQGMDLVAVAVLGAGSALFLWRRGRR